MRSLYRRKRNLSSDSRGRTRYRNTSSSSSLLRHQTRPLLRTSSVESAHSQQRTTVATRRRSGSSEQGDGSITRRRHANSMLRWVVVEPAGVCSAGELLGFVLLLTSETWKVPGRNDIQFEFKLIARRNGKYHICKEHAMTRWKY